MTILVSIKTSTVPRSMVAHIETGPPQTSGGTLKLSFVQEAPAGDPREASMLEFRAFLLLMIEILHDLIYQNLRNSGRSYGNNIWMGSCRTCILSIMSSRFLT